MGQAAVPGLCWDGLGCCAGMGQAVVPGLCWDGGRAEVSSSHCGSVWTLLYYCQRYSSGCTANMHKIM